MISLKFKEIDNYMASFILENKTNDDYIYDNINYFEQKN